MANLTYATNVVDSTTFHKVQENVLKTLSQMLMKSFGPAGSTTVIKKPGAETMYSKDGHTILSNIHFNGIIEEDVRDNIETITRRVVTTVGDGTTSAVILSNSIFKYLLKYIESKTYTSREITDAFSNVVSIAKQDIIDSAIEPTIDDIFDIAMISTNGDEKLSAEIYQIYKNFGLQVFIDVSASLSGETYAKIYDGMVLNTGLADSFYMNTDRNSSKIEHPEIYFFQHPIDTKEMAIYLDAIIERNIYDPLCVASKNKQSPEYIPTVIIAPTISQDMSSSLNWLTTSMQNTVPANRAPILIITGTHEIDELQDIMEMCGGKPIRKYIDDKKRLYDVETGAAPTPETIQNWAGHCELIESDTQKTKFVKPANMYNEDGSYSTMYNGLIEFLEKELTAAKERGDDAHVTGSLKRRINSLKSNMVEIFVGGISASDRDATRDLVEDAVLNCRSACRYGYNFGANFNAYSIIANLYKDNEYVDKNSGIIKQFTECEADIIALLYRAYNTVIFSLYNTVFGSNTDDEIEKSIKMNQPINLRTGEYDGKVKCSIEGDTVILDAVSRIISLMVTSNQYIVPTPQQNVYMDFIDPDKD